MANHRPNVIIYSLAQIDLIADYILAASYADRAAILAHVATQTKADQGKFLAGEAQKLETDSLRA